MDETPSRRRTGRRALRRVEPLLGPAAALLLGMSAGFFCFAMPARIVFPLLESLGLPAEARLALAAGVALCVGLLTWGGFHWLDRASAPRTGLADDAAPVLRRADAHPDAPARRPIFAGSDLGTPLDLIDPLPADWEAEPEPVAITGDARVVAATVVDDALIDIVPAEIIPADPAPAPAPPLPAFATLATAPEPDLIVPPAAPTPVPPADSLPSLSTMMSRLEMGLARKALALGGADTNVTPLKREIRPVAGPLDAAMETLDRRTVARR